MGCGEIGSGDPQIQKAKLDAEKGTRENPREEAEINIVPLAQPRWERLSCSPGVKQIVGFLCTKLVLQMLN